MKKLTIALFLLTATFVAKSQDSWKPVEGELGLTMQMNGIAWLGATATPDPITGQGMLWIHYMMSDDMCIRLGLGINHFGVHNEVSNTNAELGFNMGTMDSVYKTHYGSKILAIGAEKHLGSMAKFDPYLGVQLGIAMVGKQKTEITNEVTGKDSTGSDNGTASYSYTSTMPGGFGFGIGLFGGFRWYVADHLAIGSEINWGFGHLSVGGETSTTTTMNESTTIGGTTTSMNMTTNSKSTNKQGYSAMGTAASNGGYNGTLGATVGLNLTWFFGN